jgi:tRNA(Ile)-lysidine synthase
VLDRSVRAALRRHDLAGAGLLVAVSGGVDSVVLAHALAALAGPLRLRLAIGHVHHGLRGAEADADEAFVAGLAGRLALPFQARRVDPRALRAAGPSRTRPTLQEAARRLRYEALLEMASAAGLACVATAHQADDQAETVLLRLLRGTGPDGLAGIPARSPDGRIVRPLLDVPRREIEAFAAARGLAFREDASNASPAYARNRLRREHLPALAAAFNPRLLQRIAALAEAQSRDAEWIAIEVEREAAFRLCETHEGLRIVRAGWRAVPDALARRLARKALAGQGGARDVSRTHLERMVSFLRSGRTGARIELPGHLELACERDAFWLRRARSGHAARGAAVPRVLG